MTFGHLLILSLRKHSGQKQGPGSELGQGMGPSPGSVRAITGQIPGPVGWRTGRPKRVPELPATANDRRKPDPLNLKEARALNARATHGNMLVMRRSLVSDEDLAILGL